jgi:general L-amino acid transport system permease protein
MANVSLIDIEEKPRRPSWLRDERFLQLLIQVIFLAVIAALAYFMLQNLAATWKKQGMAFGFAFLFQRSGFNSALTFIEATRDVSNLQILEAGLINTIFVAILGNILSTILGLIVGLARLSKNFLVNRLAYLYIEILKNIPLLLVVIATYYVILYSLPRVKEAIALPGSVYLSNRGLEMPLPLPGPTAGLYIFGILLLFLVILIVGISLHKHRNWDGFKISFAGGLILILGAIIFWLALPQSPFSVSLPVIGGFNFLGGMSVSPELTALLMGLVLGSSPFIADVVRAGIESVSKDQIEAAQALGLSGYQTFRLVIFPQALRVMVPPMTSNYLSLTKNSSLAAAVAYPEVFGLSGTIINMTGRAVEVMLIIMGIYLSLSLLTALFMNWYNGKIRLVER